MQGQEYLTVKHCTSQDMQNLTALWIWFLKNLILLPERKGQEGRHTRPQTFLPDAVAAFEDMEVAVKDQIGSTSECIAASWEELGKTELEKGESPAALGQGSALSAGFCSQTDHRSVSTMAQKMQTSIKPLTTVSEICFVTFHIDTRWLLTCSRGNADSISGLHSSAIKMASSRWTSAQLNLLPTR